MKKQHLLIATLLVVAAVSVAVVSCKKEDVKALSANNAKETFDPRQIEDMNAYLKDFKNRMLSAAKGEDEVLSLDEAAWHLSSLANYEFANANVEYDDVRFDTLYSIVTITDGSVLLSDLALAYQNTGSIIYKFYNDHLLDNMQFRLIKVSLYENGNLTISLITTFNHNSKFLEDTCYYYENIWQVYEECDYFDVYPTYPVQSLGTTELQRVLNLIDSKPTNTNARIYYIITSSTKFLFNQYIDAYGSPSFWNSRLYANIAYFTNYDIKNDMCYYLDSYLGLGYQYCPIDKVVIGWSLELKTGHIPNYTLEVQRHELTVDYGELFVLPPSPGEDPIH